MLTWLTWRFSDASPTKDLKTELRTTVAAIGRYALEMPLATVTMSGFTPQCWWAKSLTGAAEAVDDLVHVQEDAVLLAEVGDRGQVVVGRHRDPDARS